MFQGLRFYAGDQKFKASEIDRSLSKQNLEHIFQNQVEKLPESKLLPKIEEIESPRITREVNSMSIASGAIDMLGSLTGPRLNVNKNIEEEEEEIDEGKKLKKKRGLGMRR